MEVSLFATTKEDRLIGTWGAGNAPRPACGFSAYFAARPGCPRNAYSRPYAGRWAIQIPHVYQKATKKPLWRLRNQPPEGLPFSVCLPDGYQPRFFLGKGGVFSVFILFSQLFLRC